MVRNPAPACQRLGRGGDDPHLAGVAALGLEPRGFGLDLRRGQGGVGGLGVVEPGQCRGQFRTPGGDGRVGVVGTVALVGGREHRLHRVIVGLRDGVELVVVAACTGERQAEHGLGHGVDLFIHQVHGELAPIPLVVAFATDGEEAGGDDFFCLIVLVLKLHQVACELLLEKQVIGFVAIEGLNDVVPVTPGMRVEQIDFLAAALGVAGDVQPVACPALAKAWGIEILIDDTFDGIWGGIRQKGTHLIGRGGEAGQVVGDAADERGSVRIAHGVQSGFFDRCQHMQVDVCPCPALSLDGRRFRFHGFLKSPVLAALGHIDLPFAAAGIGHFLFARVRCAHLDPLFEVRDDFIREFVFRRHLHVAIFPGDGLKDGAFSQIPWGDARMPGFSTEQGSLACV